MMLGIKGQKEFEKCLQMNFDQKRWIMMITKIHSMK